MADGVVDFPKFPLPPDAKAYKERQVEVRPDSSTTWNCMAYDESGGYWVAERVSKLQAIEAGLRLVFEDNAEMIISNRPTWAD